MSLHRFDLDDAAKEARDRLEAGTLHPASLMGELLFWLIVIVGTGVGIYAVLVLSDLYFGLPL